MASFEQYHNVKYEETIFSIAARYRQNPSNLMQRNKLDHQSELYTRNKIVVNKTARNACGRTCVLLTGKTWQRCDCTKKPKSPKPQRCHQQSYQQQARAYRYLNNTLQRDHDDDDVAMVDMAALWRPSTPDALSEDEKFARALFNKINSGNPRLFLTEEQSKFPTPTLQATTRTATLTNQRYAMDHHSGLQWDSSCNTTRTTPQPQSLDEQMAWALHNQLNHSAPMALFCDNERQKFPTPTLGKPNHIMTKTNYMYQICSESERAKFPTPTLAMHVAVPANYTLFSEQERAKFPVPTLGQPKQESPANYTLFSEVERAKFPVPTFNNTMPQQPAQHTLFSEEERSKFPIPSYEQQTMPQQPAQHKLFNQTEMTKFPIPSYEQLLLVDLN